MMNLAGSYFAINNPLHYLDRWINRFSHRKTVHLAGKPLELNWTARAQRELQKRNRPLLVEMQLYFSCVVKKRVVFHDQADFDTTPVNAHIRVAYRAVQSSACDPETFVRDYPGQRELESGAAGSMQPPRLDIDYKQGQWTGEMHFEQKARH